MWSVVKHRCSKNKMQNMPGLFPSKIDKLQASKIIETINLKVNDTQRQTNQTLQKLKLLIAWSFSNDKHHEQQVNKCPSKLW
jgi:hypothetical protein